MTNCPGLSGTVPVLPRKVPHPRKRLGPEESQDEWLSHRDTWPVLVTRSRSQWPEKGEGERVAGAEEGDVLSKAREVAGAQ